MTSKHFFVSNFGQTMKNYFYDIYAGFKVIFPVSVDLSKCTHLIYLVLSVFTQASTVREKYETLSLAILSVQLTAIEKW